MINHWAETADIEQAGNIQYAPFGANAQFFQKYYDRMLVINGVDAQTNSHSVGETHNWSGRAAEGFPTMTAMLAAHHTPELPMSYLNFGGFGATANIVPSSRIDNVQQITRVALPNTVTDNPEVNLLPDADFDLLRQLHAERDAALVAETNLTPRARRNRQAFSAARAASGGMRPFAEAIPRQDELPPQGAEGNTLAQQAIIAAIAFKTGAAVAADLFIGEFDTHQEHDKVHEPLLADLVNAVDVLWETAEQQEIADRLVVVMGSDFGRTNHYNANDGKDHWPIGSYVIMEKNVPWTNRVVGETDAIHNAYRINPASLQRDETNGTIIYPRHVHKALRSYLGLGASPLVARFPFDSTEDFGLFS